MTAPRCTDEEFLGLWGKHRGNAQSIAKELGLTAPRSVFARRRRLEVKHGAVLRATENESIKKLHRKPRLETNVKSGIILVGSDCHYHPGDPSTAHKAFVKFIKEMRPHVVVLNGDVFDGASISRWERIGWDSRPTVKQELDVCNERLVEIEDAAKGAERYWPLGNHDARFETFLAKHAPQYEGVEFFSLKDRFPKWKPCWSLWVNGTTVIKHRIRGGIHATRNNVLAAGMSTVTGHLHQLKVTPFADYKPRRRYGVDTGTMAEPYGPQFVDYLEDNPVDWASGFAVLTFHNGELLPPELVEVWGEGKVTFRGKILDL